MFYKKEGFPEESEVTLCTVKKILHDSVFASLDEYKEKEGIIHISEIAPGRIRTIREYVVEGKKILCFILRVNKERNHIEMSLRRVTTSMRVKKNQELQLEQKSEKILEHLGKPFKLSLKDMYEKIGYKILEKYGSLNIFFKEVSAGNKDIVHSIIQDKKLSDKLIELVKNTFKPQEIKISKSISIKCNASNGIEIIRSSLLKAIELSNKNKFNLKVLYMGAPRYRLTITSTEYKKAEALMDELIGFLTKELKSLNGEVQLIK